MVNKKEHHIYCLINHKVTCLNTVKNNECSVVTKDTKPGFLTEDQFEKDLKAIALVSSQATIIVMIPNKPMLKEQAIEHHC